MSDRLPPLTALRAFDAAARHMSFAKAAQELNVTPAALSFQIKSLEDHLGNPLFRRLNRAVELTDAGHALAPGAAEGFRTLHAAWSSAKRQLDTTTLTVTAGPALTAKWLAPRLLNFARAHPDIDLRLSASLRLVDLQRDDIDVAIRFGYSTAAGLYTRPARKEWFTPIMTPDMAQKYPTPESLLDAPLIADESTLFLDPPCTWPMWFRAMGIDFNPTYTARFSNADHAVDAVIAGLGVGLGRRPLIIKDVRDGLLVMPFKTAIETDARFHFACLDGAQTRPQIAAFENWFFEEIDKTADISDGFDIVPVTEISPT
jgi:LysR family glycine cleavage system transcriptional activator